MEWEAGLVDGIGEHKYVAIQRDILRRIGRAEFRVGAALPSQRELSHEYGVSLMTLRQALSALEAQGIVEQLTGKGTFVRAARVPYPASGLGSIADELGGQGIVVTTSVLRCAVEPAGAAIAARLGVAAGESVLVVERLREVGSLPVAHQVSTVPPPYAAVLADADFAVDALYAVLAERGGVVPARASETLAPAVIDADIAMALRVAPGELGLRSDRVTFDAAGVPLVHDDAVLVSARMDVTIDRELTGASSFQFHSRVIED